tara:strand:- start:642 stop:1202 length:561 start_codon:yes stop_codon:yes gene_type:complete
MILIIDNYDSFTYNLVQYIGSINQNVEVVKNNLISINDILKMKPDKIVISPGPGRPEESGISVDLIREFGHKIPILGICLGHQCIAVAYGGKVINAKQVIHGKTSDIIHCNSTLFKGIPNVFEATRYHSLVVDKNKLPEVLKITATTNNGLIMALEHNKFPVYGLQFHPESIMTSFGKKMIYNFIS